MVVVGRLVWIGGFEICGRCVVWIVNFDYFVLCEFVVDCVGVVCLWILIWLVG